ncbi:MAG: M20/M25/M40 family metallo-hydrolase [Euryarchaeota archaeon]|nr:M20/M25/M40 family metallo-hydrolase [Euryarchaeota archaeon]
MKMSKIICLVICMLMIVTVFPVVGLPIQTGETKNLNITQPRSQSPGPAYAPMPPLDRIVDVPIVRDHSEKTAVTMDDIVISIIEQVDESIFLSYEENLTANGPRPTGSASCIAAAEYMYDQFQSMGLAVRYHHWSNGGYSSDNVEATLNGTDETSDEIYIICAHYDTVSAGPGADDDTSGTAAVLIAALIMSQYQFNNTIKFVAFSGEEQGMLGSEVYAQEAAAQGWNIVGVLNCDMISYAVSASDGSNLIVFEDTASEWLYTYTVSINTKYNEYIQLTLQYGGDTWGSDHWYFWQNGYSALFYFEYTETPYYHTAQDTMAHINATYAVKNMRLIFATLAELAEGEPLSNPPATPVLTGPDSGLTNEIYTFNAVTTDPDGDDIYYLFNWGDGHNSGWLGPFISSTPANGSYIWNTPGSYDITVKAKDENGVESGLSPAHTIIINPSIQIETITGGLFKVNAVLKNNGASTATNVPWRINLSGGILLLGKTTKGTIPTIAAGDSVTISSGIIIGFGKTVITVTADTATTSQNATVILFFIKTPY